MGTSHKPGVSYLISVLLADVYIVSCHCTECDHRCHSIIVATVITVDNKLLTSSICGNDGSNYGVAKTITIMYSKDDNYI